MLSLLRAAALVLPLGLNVLAAADQVLAGDAAIAADGHAPIGIMGDHIHSKGEWMVSYRFMTMDMEDNQQGHQRISPNQITTTVANPYNMPPTVRVVPLEMTTQMHMLGLMYAPSNDVTLMAMFNYTSKEMDHLTFQGGMGTNTLGRFKTRSSGIGDTKISALWSLAKTDNTRVHLNLGLSLPTGSIDETDDVLSPMNTNPTLRLPYAMQLGSGTYDLMPGITYNGYADKLAWGAQYLATLRIGSNDEGYSLGDVQEFNIWASYQLKDYVSSSLRLTYKDEARISGDDDRIRAPVVTANPDNYGSQRLDLSVGVNLVGQQGAIRGHRLAIEYKTPLQQNFNGVQMRMRNMLTVGYQYAF